MWLALCAQLASERERENDFSPFISNFSTTQTSKPLPCSCRLILAARATRRGNKAASSSSAPSRVDRALSIDSFKKGAPSVLLPSKGRWLFPRLRIERIDWCHGASGFEVGFTIDIKNFYTGTKHSLLLEYTPFAYLGGLWGRCTKREHGAQSPSGRLLILTS